LSLQDISRTIQEEQVSFMDRDLLFWIIVPIIALIVLARLKRKHRDFFVPRVPSEEFDEVVIESPVPVLIHFYDPGHVGDQVMIAQIERLGRRASDDFGVGFIDIQESVDLAERFAPINPPCLKLFVDGKVRRTYEGIFDEVDVYHMVMDELARDS
jgi:thioredoxin-like negative regulator of GroEL